MEEDIFIKYLNLKYDLDGEREVVTRVPYCDVCEKENPPVEEKVFPKRKITVCAVCGTPITYKIFRKIVRSKEFEDFLNSLPKYRREGDKFVFSDGAVMEYRVIGTSRPPSGEQDELVELFCTKCNKWQHKHCVHFISLEEEREMEVSS